jgi:hypothetical protein
MARATANNFTKRLKVLLIPQGKQTRNSEHGGGTGSFVNLFNKIQTSTELFDSTL